MSDPVATYSFLPWLRLGIANAMQTPEAGKLRAAVKVDLNLRGDEGDAPLVEVVSKNIQLYGPGDVVGIESRAVIRSEPRNWITNFEPNYLPFVEFYDEDFPWRYSPAVPNRDLHRLQPWLALVVLKEDEFTEGTNIKDKPLPYVSVSDVQLFPPSETLWAWAHVHINRSLLNDGQFSSLDTDSVLPKLQATLNENPDLAYSRLMSPRKLEPNTPYHAFLMPAFESGRLSGLGLNQSKAPEATASAWGMYPNKEDPNNYPVYHRWYFRTGTVGDFEYLVRLLQPKPVDKRVGTRDMDVQRPGVNMPDPTEGKPELGNILRLGGALKIPEASLKPDELEEVQRYENWAKPYPVEFQQKLADLINLSDDYSEQEAGVANQKANQGYEPSDPDPLITPPLYGRWHALTQRLLENRNDQPVPNRENWVHDLNLDPRHRVAAGFGTRVVQERQEDYMNAAWEQVGEVLEANRRIRAAQLAKEVSWIWYDRHLLPLQRLSSERTFSITAPVTARVLAQGTTVRHQMRSSLIAPSVTSMPMRRMIRPRGRFMQALPFRDAVQPNTLLTRINAGEVSAAPPKEAPSGAVTLDLIARGMLPKDAPSLVVEGLRRSSWLRYLPLALILLIVLLILFFGFNPAALVLGGLAIWGLWLLYRRLQAWGEQIEQAETLREENQTPESVDRLPKSPDFVIAQPGSGSKPTQGNSDSPEAVRFKTALKDVNRLIGASLKVGIEPPKAHLDVVGLANLTLQAITPERTIPRSTLQGLVIPERIRSVLGEQFVEVMAYPEFDIPMYKPLSDISSELFLPNLNFIESNSITLLETNQKFIEAYLLGLNHEFARELLWREYPTDQRGSYFRQFWDVSGYLDNQNLDPAALREKLRDIPPIHRWPKTSDLGDHDHREAAGDKEEEVVLVIRGELLKKYPNAVIYAHQANWQRKSDGSIDNTKERALVALSEAEQDNPPRTKVKTPLYQAKVEPDIYFFGFDLTASRAKGGTGENPGDEAGWYFVIKERPGEPRFGLDIDQQPKLQLWSDLSWDDVQPGQGFIPLNQTFTLQPIPSDSEAETPARQQQRSEDINVAWNANTNAADLAYILYQVPVMVAVHASELLPSS